MEDRKSNAIQVLNLLYLIKKLEEIKEVSYFNELIYLTYLCEISKKNIDIARVNYIDPTGLGDYWNDYNYNNYDYTTTDTTGNYTENNYGYDTGDNIVENYDTGIRNNNYNTTDTYRTSYNGSMKFDGNNKISKLFVHGGAYGSAGGIGGLDTEAHHSMDEMEYVINKYYPEGNVSNGDYNHSGLFDNFNSNALNAINETVRWDDSNPKVLCGWSVGADTIAQYADNYKSIPGQKVFDLVIIDGANIPVYLKESQINNIASKSKMLVIITHDQDELNSTARGKRRSDNLVNPSKLPNNVMHIRVNSTHQNTGSSGALDNVLKNWYRLKEANIKQIRWN